MKPTPVPSLDDIANGHTRRLSELDLTTLGALLEETNAVHGALAVAILKRAAHERRVAAKAGVGAPDSWLTPAEAAEIAKLPPRWFYRHSAPCGCDRCRNRVSNGNALPFIKRASHRSLRISKLGLEAWLAEKAR